MSYLINFKFHIIRFQIFKLSDHKVPNVKYKKSIPYNQIENFWVLNFKFSNFKLWNSNFEFLGFEISNLEIQVSHYRISKLKIRENRDSSCVKFEKIVSVFKYYCEVLLYPFCITYKLILSIEVLMWCTFDLWCSEVSNWFQYWDFIVVYLKWCSEKIRFLVWFETHWAGCSFLGEKRGKKKKGRPKGRPNK